MGSDSKIEWTDHTFNPWIGCTKVSAACENCYAARQAKRTKFAKHAFGPKGVRYIVSDRQWREPLKWNAVAQAAGRPALVFCGSMCDVFEERSGLDEQRARLWKLIADTKHLRWMLLTKRPENVVWMVPKVWFPASRPYPWPAHVAVGVTIENQKTCDVRLLTLLSIPAAMRFVSCEPLLGRVWLPEDQRKQLDWVITGGESGPKARPTHPDWIRSLRDQCAASNTPFLFKQWGEYAPGTVKGKRWVLVLADGKVYCTKKARGPSDQWFACEIEMGHHAVALSRVGRNAAGRELDGVEHLEFPAWAERKVEAGQD